MTSDIPKIVHQTWRHERVPARFSDWVASWKRHHPSWRYRLWLDADLDALVRQTFPGFLRTWCKVQTRIQRADIGRCLVLDRYGGVYADLDVACLKPLDETLDGKTCLLATEPTIHAEKIYGRPTMVSNAVMASVARHPFWSHVRSQFEQSCQERPKMDPDPLPTTGPLALDDAAKSFCGELTLAPPDVFCPLPDVGNKRLALDQATLERYQEMEKTASWPKATVAVHYWAHSWFVLARLRHEIEHSCEPLLRTCRRVRTWVGLARR